MSISDITFSDLLLFLIGAAIEIVGIWIGIYLYMRQQREAQDEKYDRINRSLVRINDGLKELSNQLIAGISEIKAQVTLIDRATTHTQAQMSIARDQMLDKVLARLLDGRMVVKLTGYKVEPESSQQETVGEHSKHEKVGGE